MPFLLGVSLPTILNLSDNDKANTEDDDVHHHQESLNFATLFKAGGVGRALFKEHVVPFMTLRDLIVGAKTSRQMNTMCRTYTIGEIFAMKLMNGVPRYHKLELGKFILATEGGKYRSNTSQKRTVREGGSTFRARLYHPSAVHRHCSCHVGLLHPTRHAI